MDLQFLLQRKAKTLQPTTVVYVGSMAKASAMFTQYAAKDTINGLIVIPPFATKTNLNELSRIDLDVLHLFKIDRCDFVRVFNIGGYIGDSTSREIEYAIATNKRLVFLEYNAAMRYVQCVQCGVSAEVRQVCQFCGFCYVCVSSEHKPCNTGVFMEDVLM